MSTILSPVLHAASGQWMLGKIEDHVARPMSRPEIESFILLHDSMFKNLAMGTEARVCHDIASRQKMGIAKYGITVSGNPLELKEWLQHAYEECLDQAIYLKRAMEEMDK